MERDRDYRCREFKRKNSKNNINKSKKDKRYENKYKTRGV